MHRAGVTGDRVPKRILGRYREIIRRAGCDRTRKAADGQSRCSRRIDDDSSLGTGDRRGHCVRRRDRSCARSLQRGAERVHAGITAGERVVGRQHGLSVAAGEMRRAGIASGSVAKRVPSCDCEIVRCSRRHRTRMTGNHKVRRRGRANGKSAAQPAGQTRGCRGQLLSVSSSIDAEIRVSNGPVPGGGADVEAGCSLERPRAGRERVGNEQTGPQSGGRVIAELILGLDDGLNTKDCTGSGRAWLGGEAQLFNRPCCLRKRPEARAARAGHVCGGGDSADCGRSGIAGRPENIA